MKINYVNGIDEATVTATAVDVDYPAANLKDIHLSKEFRSGTNSTDIDVNAGGGLKSITQAYTNIVQDPTDLTTVNWDFSTLGPQPVLVDEFILGNQFTKLTTSGIAGSRGLTQEIVYTSSNISQLSIYIRNIDSSSTSRVGVLDGTFKGRVDINWSSKIVTLTNGQALDYEFVDDITVRISLITDSITHTNTNTLIIYPDPTNSTTATSVLATMVQCVDNTTTMFPFIDGSKSADVITETFTMPSRFIIDCVFTPSFAYDDSTSNRPVWTWDIDSTHRLMLFYEEAVDIFRFYWINGGVGSAMTVTNPFDDITYFINKRLRIIGSFDLISGGLTDSRGISILLDQNELVYENTVWTIIPDIRTDDFSTLNIGKYASSSVWSNSEYEYIRIYPGLLVGDVTSSDDATALLADKTPLLDLTYQSKITATELYIAGHNLQDGDLITLKGNDVDSWGPGTPLEETVEWSKDVINHVFTKSNYQYYRLSIQSSSTSVNMGRMWLGQPIEIMGPYISFAEVHNNTSTTKISISGQVFGDEGYIFKTYEMGYPYWTAAEKDDIEAFANTVNKAQPFFATFADSDDCTLGPLYCIMTNDMEFTHLLTLDIWSSLINFREVF